MPSPKIVAGLLTLVVLATGLLSNVGPEETLLRGGIAYVVGLVAGNIWHSLFALPNRTFSEAPADEESEAPQDETETPPLAA